MKQQNVIVLVIVIAVIIIIAALLFRGGVEAPTNDNVNTEVGALNSIEGTEKTTPAPNTSSNVPAVSVPQPPAPVADVTVTYTDEGYMTSQFSPTTVTIEQGDTVLFINNTNEPMWIASDPHPADNALPNFNQRTSVGKGGTYMYTFTQIGKWDYHNHLNYTRGGRIIVKQAQ